jgi:CRISP-associated protein Cas1
MPSPRNASATPAAIPAARKPVGFSRCAISCACFELRLPGTREGVNGMLDYGYAILRTAVLRSLAAHGFIAAIGIAHTAKAGSFALADDVMEPLRPWIDRELKVFLQGGKRPMQEWMRQAVSVLQIEVAINRNKLRLLNAIDLYVQSFADASMSRTPLLLKVPMLP